MKRASHYISSEIGMEQSCFMREKGTRNAILMQRTLTELAVQVQRDFFIFYIDTAKAFDKVQHGHLK